MTRTLEIRRHTDNDGDRLTADGVAHAMHLGQEELADSYTVVATTGAHRTMQTAACMLAAGTVRVAEGVIVVPALRSDREDDWRAAYQEAGSGHLRELERAAPDLVSEDAALLAGGLRDVLSQVGIDERALIIGHSPTNEAAVLGLTGQIVDPLGKGEGVVVAVDGDRFEVSRA